MIHVMPMLEGHQRSSPLTRVTREQIRFREGALPKADEPFVRSRRVRSTKGDEKRAASDPEAHSDGNVLHPDRIMAMMSVVGFIVLSRHADAVSNSIRTNCRKLRPVHEDTLTETNPEVD